MNKSWIYKKLVLKVIKFIFKHRHSMGKVKLYFGIARLLVTIEALWHYFQSSLLSCKFSFKSYILNGLVVSYILRY